MGKTRAQIARKHTGGASAVVPASPPSAGARADTTPRAARSNGTLVLVAAASAGLLLFWYYHLLTLGQMTQLSGGLTMPDMLVGGYDVGYVEQLRAAMDDDARGQLSYLHRTAGTLFPLIFAFGWLLLVQLNVGRRRLRWALWAPVILFVIADLWENVAIDTVLAQPVPDAGAVVLASILTIARWVLLAASLAAGATAAFLPPRLRGARQREVQEEEQVG